MRVLGCDPGGSTGAAILQQTPKAPYPIIKMEIITFEHFNSWVDLLGSHPWEFDVMALEDFIARPQFTDGVWTELPTAKQVGILQYRCHQLGKLCVLQQPSIKPAGYAAIGMTYSKGKKGMHIQDAAAHAAYLLKHGRKAS